MSQSLDIWTSGLQQQLQQMRQVASQVPDLKKQMLARIGDRLAREVKESVGRSGLHDVHGRVAGWQNPHIGTGTGYVAVRADSVEVPAGGSRTERVNAGALTNYLINDRRVRGPSGRSKRYRSRARRAVIPGRDFYGQAAQQAVKIAEAEGRQMLDQLAGEVEQV